MMTILRNLVLLFLVFLGSLSLAHAIIGYMDTDNPVVSVKFDEGEWVDPIRPAACPWVVIFTDENHQALLGWTSSGTVDVEVVTPSDPPPDFVPKDDIFPRPGTITTPTI
jgi:hypothetical protein